ncbi:hypothetical protein PAGL106935_27055 [Paenibacillus glucanolyticus]|jgi:hypothetical protein
MVSVWKLFIAAPLAFGLFVISFYLFCQGMQAVTDWLSKDTK